MLLVGSSAVTDMGTRHRQPEPGTVAGTLEVNCFSLASAHIVVADGIAGAPIEELIEAEPTTGNGVYSIQGLLPRSYSASVQSYCCVNST